MSKLHAAITGVGGYVPDYVLTNAELETMVDTNDEWITTRTGIKERRILKGEGKGSSVMAAKAAQEVLKKTNTAPEDIDLVIVVIASGMHKKVLVIGADKMSSIIDYKDRTTCIIFGDGAGAVLLEPTTEDVGIMDAIHKADGAGAEFLYMKAGGSRYPASIETVQNREHYARQDGSTVFKFAVTNMADYAAKIMERNDLKSEDISWLVAHQANKRIIDATAKRMGIGDEKVMMNIERYGNTTAATIPLLLWDYEKQLNKGENLVLAAFGGGFTWGAIYVKWAYDSE
ncbi:MAG: ketoacyl-ACP synthase III [Cyclobacteriaceae bacterium]